MDDALAEGDTVSVRFTGRGTHQGTFNGIPPTGKQITFAGQAIYRIADGKIQEGWALFDALGLLQQLGALPQR